MTSILGVPGGSDRLMLQRLSNDDSAATLSGPRNYAVTAAPAVHGPVPISVIIPTRNEERNIAACMDAVAWADEIVVFDSLSTDATTAIATSKGARVVERAFDSFARHKNWALDHIELRNGWVLLVDADERVTPELAAEMRAAVARPDAPAGYYIPRKTFFQGRWVRHGGVYPDYNMRLFRRGRGRYEDRLVHEHVVLDGPAGYLANPLTHADDKGLERYFDRHNHYTTLEAIEIVRAEKRDRNGKLHADVLVAGPPRRRALKNFAQRYLPARPVFLFLYMYVLKGGFLDGRVGFRYFLLKMLFDYFTDLKVREIRTPGTPLNLKYQKYVE